MRARLRLAWRRWAPHFEYRAVDGDGDYIESDWGGWQLHDQRTEAEAELAAFQEDIPERERGRVERRLVGPWV